MAVYGGAIAIIFIIFAVFSWELIKGIPKHDVPSVVKYKWFLIISLFLYILNAMCQIIFEDSWQVPQFVHVVVEIGLILLLLYIIFVIDSLEMMFREKLLPVVQQPAVQQPAVRYQPFTLEQLTPRIPGQIVTSRLYFTPASQQATEPCTTHTINCPANINMDRGQKHLLLKFPLN